MKKTHPHVKLWYHEKQPVGKEENITGKKVQRHLKTSICLQGLCFETEVRPGE